MKFNYSCWTLDSLEHIILIFNISVLLCCIILAPSIGKYCPPMLDPLFLLCWTNLSSADGTYCPLLLDFYFFSVLEFLFSLNVGKFSYVGIFCLFLLKHLFLFCWRNLSFPVGTSFSHHCVLVECTVYCPNCIFHIGTKIIFCV